MAIDGSSMRQNASASVVIWLINTPFRGRHSRHNEYFLNYPGLTVRMGMHDIH